MQGDGRIASTLKRCCSNARAILKIVNILKVLKTPHPKYEVFQLFPPSSYYMQLSFIRNGKIIQIKEIAELPVMSDGFCTPPPHTHVPSATTL